MTLGPWQAIDRGDDDDPGPGAGPGGARAFDWKVLLILVGAALTMTLEVYLGPKEIGRAVFAIDQARHASLEQYAWWTAWRLLGYVLVPAAIVLALPGERVLDGHLSPRAVVTHPLGYAVLAAALGAVIYRAVAASEDPRWQVLFVLQLLALEVFFRGFLLHGLRRALGANALFVMVVPYCMLHYDSSQPMVEALASIGVGLILGTLAMRTRSIWPGALLMVAVAALIGDVRLESVIRRTATSGSEIFRTGLTTTGYFVLGAGVVAALVAWARARDHVVWRAIATLSIKQWRAIDEDPGPGAAVGPRRVDWKVLVILATACVSLTLQEYVGQRDQYEKWFPYDALHPDRYWSLKGFVWWTGWRVFGYLLMPMAVILCLPGERLRDYHVSPRGFLRHLWIYGIMFALILPAVWIASHTQTFRHTYPFYKLAPRSSFDLWSWELMYAVQFLSLEFFFRGFLLQGLRRALGANAIFVMIVPYCMIHYGKPMAETFGAIGAGLILGTLAMRTRSIWGGIVIHVCVAWTMDLLAIQHCRPTGCR